MNTFEELGVRDDLLKAIHELGFENPMPVQEKVIPHLLNEDGDVIALHRPEPERRRHSVFPYYSVSIHQETCRRRLS